MKGKPMAAVMIGVDPHKGSHTAVVIDQAERVLDQVRVRACAAQAERLLAWAAAWPRRTWAIESAGGLGHLLAHSWSPRVSGCWMSSPSRLRGYGCWPPGM
jgi:hypothetical protein